MALSCAIGRNISHLCYNCNIRPADSLSQCVYNRVYRRTQIHSEYEAIVNRVQYLLSCMQGTSYIDSFDSGILKFPRQILV